MTEHAKPAILFVEDEDEHFVPVALHLATYNCKRAKKADIPKIRKLARQWKPVAAVVDWMIYSSSEEAKRAARAVEDAINRLQHQVRGDPSSSADPATNSPPILDPLSGLDCIPVLREECPSIQIVLFSQHFGFHEVNSAGEIVVAKKLVHGHHLANADEIAREIRSLLQAL